MQRFSRTNSVISCNPIVGCGNQSAMETGGLEHVKKLWMLIQIVETGSLRKAASRVKVTAPAVSQAISSLEKILGKKLLVRNDNGVKPTSEALSLVQEVAPAIKQLLELSSLNPTQTPKISWISLGTYESLAIDILPKLVHRFQRKLPETKLTVRVARTATLATMIRKGELCAALVSESDCLGGLRTVQLGEDRLGFFVSETFDKIPTCPEQLRSVPVGLLSPGSDGYPYYFKRFLAKTLGEKYKPVIVSDSFEALRATAASGCAVCVLPARVAARQPGLVEIKLGNSLRDSGIHKLLLAAEPNCDVQEFKFLEEELGELLSIRPTYPITQ